MSATSSNICAGVCPLPRVVRNRDMDGQLPAPSGGAEAGSPCCTQSREILARMMRGPGKRGCRYQEEPLGIGAGLVGFELLRRHEGRDWVMLAGGLEILADGHEVDARRAQIVHDLEDLGAGFAKAHHYAGLGEHA